MLKNIFIIILISLLGATMGLFLGAWIGGNYDFPELFGTRGYEAGGITVGILGFLIGMGVATWVVKKN